jgi:hypothetical protein
MGKLRSTVELITDDRDGQELPENTRSISLAYDGKEWELYLSEQNRIELEQLIRQFTRNAEPTGAPKRKRRVLLDTHGHDPKVVRAWALRQDPPLAQPRGRLSQKAYDAFEAHRAS